MQHESNIHAATEASAIVNCAEFLTAMETMCKVIDRRAVPILQNVRLMGTKSGLMASCTDLDIEAHYLVPGDVDSRLRVTVPAFTLKDWIKAAQGESVTITATFSDPADFEPVFDDDGNQVNEMPEFSSYVRFECAGSETSLQALPTTDWPESMALVEPCKFTLSRHGFNDLLKSVSFAISTEENRYYLNGVYIGIDRAGHDDAVMNFVATDGHRLAKASIDCPEIDGTWTGTGAAYGATGISAVMPRKTIGLLQWATQDVRKSARLGLNDHVIMGFTESKMSFASGRLLVRSKLIDGTFPDYNRVIPTGNDKPMTVNADAFRKAIESVSKVSSERGGKVKLVLDQGRCDLVVNNPEQGSAKGAIRVEYDSEPMEIGFNSAYLIEILKSFGKDAVTFEFLDPGAPALIRSGKANVTTVLMPMRV